MRKIAFLPVRKKWGKASLGPQGLGLVLGTLTGVPPTSVCPGHAQRAYSKCITGGFNPAVLGQDPGICTLSGTLSPSPGDSAASTTLHFEKLNFKYHWTPFPPETWIAR